MQIYSCRYPLPFFFLWCFFYYRQAYNKRVLFRTTVCTDSLFTWTGSSFVARLAVNQSKAKQMPHVHTTRCVAVKTDTPPDRRVDDDGSNSNNDNDGPAIRTRAERDARFRVKESSYCCSSPKLVGVICLICGMLSLFLIPFVRGLWR
jgi:hypothetical protein